MNFSKILIKWYSINKRNLPWRNTVSPYNIWLSEIILQQTQVKQGMPYYLRFIKEFPTIFDLAKTKETNVLNLWQGLGYYSRARNLHFTAKYIVDELNGIFPNNYQDLIKLKGIGDYTASAIASICFNEPTPVVDGNVYRFLSRYFGVKTPINSSKAKKEFKELANKLIDTKIPAEFNQAIMEFGALQCKPQNLNCNSCPFNSSCVALQKELVKELPVKLKKIKITNRYFNYLVILSCDNRTILQQRKGKGIWQNLYQFPLVETSKKVCLSALEKNQDFIKILKGKNYSISRFNESDIIHKLSHQHIYTKFWILNVEELPEKGILTEKVKNYPVPTLMDNFINKYNF